MLRRGAFLSSALVFGVFFASLGGAVPTHGKLSMRMCM
jgi:hypothetical protein